MSSPKIKQESPSPEARVLGALGERYIEETMARFPSVGSSMGRHEFDGELEAPSEQLMRAQQKLLKRTLAEVESIPEQDLRGDAWLDRRALLAELRTETWSHERETFRRNPESWASSALGSVHQLVVRSADDLTPAAEAIATANKAVMQRLDISAFHARCARALTRARAIAFVQSKSPLVLNGKLWQSRQSAPALRTLPWR